MNIPAWMNTFLDNAFEGIKDMAEQELGSGFYDDVYKACAYTAYTQICGYLGARRFASDGVAVSKLFRNVEDELFFQDHPITEIVKVAILDIDGTEEELDTDTYLLDVGENHSSIIFSGLTGSSAFLTGAESSVMELVKVEYKYGYTSIEEHDILQGAVISQGLNIFKKKDYVGYASTTQVSPINPVQADIPLLESVKLTVEPLRYWNP